MVGLAIEALRSHPTPLRHSHILVDETQDTSERQLQVCSHHTCASRASTSLRFRVPLRLRTSAAQLLQLLAPRGMVALTAVGDDDQTIYGFRGSRPDVHPQASVNTLCALCTLLCTRHTL